jgi:hypothetical protein
VNLNEELWRILKYLEDARDGPDAHVHAGHLGLGKEEFAFL